MLFLIFSNAFELKINLFVYYLFIFLNGLVPVVQSISDKTSCVVLNLSNLLLGSVLRIEGKEFRSFPFYLSWSWSRTLTPAPDPAKMFRLRNTDWVCKLNIMRSTVPGSGPRRSLIKYRFNSDWIQNIG